MGMREDIENMKKEVEEIKEESTAMEIVRDYKVQNKRLFIIILVILGMWFATIEYLVYVLNDIGIIEETTTYEQEVSDIDNIGGNVINKGNDYGEDKTNN